MNVLEFLSLSVCVYEYMEHGDCTDTSTTHLSMCLQVDIGLSVHTDRLRPGSFPNNKESRHKNHIPAQIPSHPLIKGR